ncbi:hypothetical protein PIB30_085644 [Stylosanthes scabra]|uniref:Uncharacterized protein n=1 Tax=Stylosanthes scabra TaxID=79078 RepID=A0ABU6WSK5_9FABA|nr:hypothetical protein [Stylosanthes scabra]
MAQSSVHKCIAGKLSNPWHTYRHYQLRPYCHLKDRKSNKRTKQGKMDKGSLRSKKRSFGAFLDRAPCLGVQDKTKGKAAHA